MAVALLVVVVHRPLLAGFSRCFQVDDTAPSDAVVVRALAPRVGELYRDGIAPVLLVPQTDAIPCPDFSTAEIERQILMRRGVPDSAIRVLPSVGVLKDTAKIAARVND